MAVSTSNVMQRYEYNPPPSRASSNLLPLRPRRSHVPHDAAFGESSDTGGEFHISAAGENGVFSRVRTGLKAEAGGRPLGNDGLQTFGGVRALARYVKIEAAPAEGGRIDINEASPIILMENTDRRSTLLGGRYMCGENKCIYCVMNGGTTSTNVLVYSGTNITVKSHQYRFYEALRLALMSSIYHPQTFTSTKMRVHPR